MLNTIQYLDSLPVYERSEQLPAPWLELCSTAIDLCAQDFIEMAKQVQAMAGVRLLNNIQFDDQLCLNPSHMIGSLFLYPDDIYRQKTHQPTLQELRAHRSTGRYTLGLELEIALYRQLPAPHLGRNMNFASYVNFSLNLHHGREMDAFRDIYDNYRGIVGKLLDFGQIEFSMSSVISEVEAVRSKKPLPRLDAVLHLKDPNPDEQWFDLNFAWYPNRTFEEGVRALTAQAILFTCIQRASVSSRARRDFIMDMWNSLQLNQMPANKGRSKNGAKRSL